MQTIGEAAGTFVQHESPPTFDGGHRIVKAVCTPAGQVPRRVE
jgi:hypothetical protein